MDVKKIEEKVAEGTTELKIRYAVSPMVVGGVAILAYFIGKRAGANSVCIAIAKSVLQQRIDESGKAGK